MNELTVEKKMTTKEIANKLTVDVKTIRENAKKCLPDKEFENGKQTYWTEKEVTILIEYMKNHKGNNRPNLYLQGTGSIACASTSLTPALKMQKAMLMMQEAYEEELAIIKAKNEQQQKLLLEQQPKVEFFDDVTGSSDTIDMKEVAKILNVKNIGRNKLFEILRQKNILDRNNQPYQQYVDAGYFRVIESKYNTPDGSIKINLKTVVFQKGLDFIRKQIKGIAA